MIEQRVYERIKTLAGGRVFPGVAPEGTPAPYATYQLTGGDRDWTLSGPSGSRRASVQVTAWAQNPGDAATLIDLVFSLVSPSGPDFSCTGVQDLPTDDDQMATALHGAAMEFFLIR